MSFSDIDWVGILGKVVLAIVIIAATWILAAVVRWAIKKLVQRVGFLQREGNDGQAIGDSIGSIASLLIWLFGLMAVLQLFALTQVLAPIQSLLTDMLSFLPNLVGAIFVFAIGFVVAKIVRQLVETALGAVNFAKLSRKASAGASTLVNEASGDSSPSVPAGDPAPPKSALSNIPSIVGNLVFAIILIVVSIAALQILGISAISDPAEQMLQLFLTALPSIIAAALILGLGYLISSFLGNLLETTLKGLGVDASIAKLEILPAGASASTIITRVVQVAIMVFFAIMAARSLGFPEVTEILNEVLALGGKVLFGGVIIAAGFLIANLIVKFMGKNTASTVVKWATVALFTAMGLSYMGIADSIITLAFGAVVVGGALAAALAYGLGGREAAAESLAKLKVKKAADPTMPGTTHTPPPADPTG